MFTYDNHPKASKRLSIQVLVRSMCIDGENPPLYQSIPLDRTPPRYDRTPPPLLEGGSGSSYPNRRRRRRRRKIFGVFHALDRTPPLVGGGGSGRSGGNKGGGVLSKGMD